MIVPPSNKTAGIFKILEYDEVDSTNDEAKRLIRAIASSTSELSGQKDPSLLSSSALSGQKEPSLLSSSSSELYGTIVLARRQSAGKGRRGKTFFSPGGDSIYASFILKPPENLAEQSITTLAGEAVCEAIEKCTSYQPEIKGVNDIFAGGRKVCGILTEGVPNAVILGIGVNINLEENDFPEELRDIAGSLHLTQEERGRFFSTLAESVLSLEY